MREFKNIIAIILIITLLGCKSGGSAYENSSYRQLNFNDIENVAGKFSTREDVFLDSSKITPFFEKYIEFKSYKKAVYRFYESRKYRLAWFDENGLIEQSFILFNKIQTITEHGIKKDIHYVDDYMRAMDAESRDSLSWYELMITSQYLHYSENILLGLEGYNLRENEWFIPRKKVKMEILLENMLSEENSSMDTMFFYQYILLKNQLGKLNEIYNKGGWNIPHDILRSLKPGDSSNNILEIKKRLIQEGYEIEDSADVYFGDDLKKAVQDFQNNNGLTADGIIGKSTLKKMQISTKERLVELIINMERCRWLPYISKEKHILVNIPDFSLYVIQNDSTLFTMPVIVGKESNKTVIFRSTIEELVFSPYWNIPNSILQKEILPLIAKDPEYIQANKMEWNDGKLRQKPGPWNALGGLKFNFPNPFHIYLHDTPSKYLFKNEKRDFSHGCIRVDDAAKLAENLLVDEMDWDIKRIKNEMSRKQELVVPLKKKIPIYIIYLTAFVGSDKKLKFRDDIYKRNENLKNMILN